MWRFKVEHSLFTDEGEFILRLPLRIGISFWKPYWQLMFGFEYSPIEWIVEWHFLCFAGEIWIDLEG